MSERSHGYNVSVGYSYGFFREMAPDWLDFCVRIAGYEPPRRHGNAFRYLELGCGQGFGLCILAAANPNANFVGIDLQPEHVAHGEGLARTAGLTNVRFVEGDFVELAADWPRDLGTFDYAALHGILSWISDSVRESVVRCLLHATHPGSLVYAGYSAQPGWIATIPFQHFSLLIKDTTGKGDSSVRSDSTALFDRLAAANAPIFQVLPTLKSRVDAVKAKDENYFIHEYLQESWRPLWHSEVAGALRRAKLDFAASATIAESLLPRLLRPPLRELIEEQQNDDLRGDLQDLVVNQGFRRDIFCRESPRLTENGLERAGETLLYLVPNLVPGNFVTFATAFGEVRFEWANFVHIVDALSDGPKSVNELLSLPCRAEMSPQHVLTLLLHASILGVGAAQSGDVAVSQRINAVIARAAVDGAPYRDVAAAALGSGIHLTESDLMLIDAWIQSSESQDDAEFANAISERLQDGESARERELAKMFMEVTLPRYRQLGVLE